MFNRFTLKSRAKAVLSLHYWPTFLAMLLAGLITSSISFSTNFFSQQQQVITDEMAYIPPAVLFALLAALLLITIIALAFTVFVTGPILVGTKKFLLNTALENNSEISAIFHGFKSGYKTIATTTLMKQLIYMAYALIPFAAAFVWVFVMAFIMGFGGTATLDSLFIGTSVPLVVIIALIPYIMKCYDYYLVDYILAENPDMHWREVLKKSKEMMRGNRWSVFVLNMSFIGWMLLGLCACFIGVLFVDPYIQATDAQLYLELTGRGNVEATSEETETADEEAETAEDFPETAEEMTEEEASETSEVTEEDTEE